MQGLIIFSPKIRYEGEMDNLTDMKITFLIQSSDETTKHEGKMNKRSINSTSLELTVLDSVQIFTVYKKNVTISLAAKQCQKV